MICIAPSYFFFTCSPHYKKKKRYSNIKTSKKKKEAKTEHAPKTKMRTPGQRK